jgi:hypothetical protein
LVDGGLSILQYADDAIIILDDNLEGARNMKLVLCAFEHFSGLKINFYKSELFCYSAAKQIELEYSQIFGCEQGKFPFKYLGIPMHHRKLSNLDRKRSRRTFPKNVK